MRLLFHVMNYCCANSNKVTTSLIEFLEMIEKAAKLSETSDLRVGINETPSFETCKGNWFSKILSRSRHITL